MRQHRWKHDGVAKEQLQDELHLLSKRGGVALLSTGERAAWRWKRQRVAVEVHPPSPEADSLEPDPLLYSFVQGLRLSCCICSFQ